MTKKAKHKRKKQPIDMSLVDLRVGKMIYVQEHPVAPDTLYFPLVNVNEPFERSIAAGLARDYSTDELENQLVVVVANLWKITVYGVRSEGLVLCARTDERLEVLSPPPGSEPGDRVTVQGCTLPSTKLRKITDHKLDTIIADLWVDSDKRAVYKGVPLQVEGKGFVTTDTLSNCPVVYPVKYL